MRLLCNSQATPFRVELIPFNDYALNRDLMQLCESANQASPRLPDGRRLFFNIHSTCCILLKARMPLEYRDSLIVSSRWHLFKVLRLYTTIGMVSVLLLVNLYLAKLHDWFYISVIGHISLKYLGVGDECG
jgi:hypothetical protein